MQRSRYDVVMRILLIYEKWRLVISEERIGFIYCTSQFRWSDLLFNIEFDNLFVHCSFVIYAYVSQIIIRYHTNQAPSSIKKQKKRFKNGITSDFSRKYTKSKRMNFNWTFKLPGSDEEIQAGVVNMDLCESVTKIPIFSRRRVRRFFLKSHWLDIPAQNEVLSNDFLGIQEISMYSRLKFAQYIFLFSKEFNNSYSHWKIDLL